MTKLYIITFIGILLAVASCNKSGNSTDKHEDILMSDKDSCAGYRVINNKVYFDEQILDADPRSFECIKYEYSKDRHHVFFSTKRVKYADPQSFTVLKHGYSKDKNYVYYEFYSGKKILGADAKTFKVLATDITKDKNSVYRINDNNIIEKMIGVDAKSFRPYKDGYYIDKTYLYGATGDKIAKLDTIDIKSLLDGQ